MENALDYSKMLVAAVGVLPLVLGWVEAAKKLGLQGRASFVLALVLGAGFAALHQAMSAGLLPEAALPWINVAVVGLGGSLAATGLYDFAKRFQSD